jgi:hypothetical protein
MIPLILSLEYAAAHPPAEKKIDGLDLVRELVMDIARG